MEQITILEHSPEGAIRVLRPCVDETHEGNFVGVDPSIFCQPEEDLQEFLTPYDSTLIQFLNSSSPDEMYPVPQEPPAHESFCGDPATALPSANSLGFWQFEDIIQSESTSPLRDTMSADQLEPIMFNPPVRRGESPVRLDRLPLDTSTFTFRDHISTIMNSPTTSTSSEYFSSPTSPSVYPPDCESGDIGVNLLMDNFTRISDLGPNGPHPFYDVGAISVEEEWNRDMDVAASTNAIATLETFPSSSPLGQLVDKPPSLQAYLEMSSIIDASQCVQRDITLPSSNWKGSVAPYAVTKAAKERRKASSKKLFSCPHCGVDFTAKHNLKYHIYSHFGIKKYDCKWCKSAFGTPYVLARHIKTCQKKLLEPDPESS